MICRLVLFIAIAVTCANGANDVDVGKKGIIEINEISSCKNEAVGPNTQLDVLDRTKTEKIINGTIKFDVDITDDLLLSIVMDKKVPGAWQNNYMNIRGKACTRINELFPKFMTRFSKSTTPIMGATCPYKKGKYSLANFVNKFSSNETNIPTVPYGRFRMHLKLTDKNKKAVWCLELDDVLIRRQ